MEKELLIKFLEKSREYDKTQKFKIEHVLTLCSAFAYDCEKRE